MYNRLMRRHGFTLVELLIVISVLAILASVVVVSYGPWRTRTAQTEVQNDLKHAAVAMENYKNFNDGYPSVAAGIPDSFSASQNVTITLKSSSPASFCLQGNSKLISSVQFYVTNTKTTPTTVAC